MHTKLVTRFLKLLLGLLLGLMVLSFFSTGSGPSVVRAKEVEPFQVRAGLQDSSGMMPAEFYTASEIKLADGEIVKKHNLNGPPQPPPGFEAQRAPVTLPKANGTTANTIVNPGNGGDAYVLGCSSTAATHIGRIYDRSGYPNVIGGLESAQLATPLAYPNLYSGPTNGGVLPVDNSLWPIWTDVVGDSYTNNPFNSSHLGVDGRTTRGTIDDYWVSYQSGQPDPYITGHWQQHPYGDSIADYMHTSQSAFGNDDGSTAFYTYVNGAAPLTCDTMAQAHLPDGSLGMKQFYAARGYSVTTCYNQPTDNIAAGGFTFAQLKAEIDVGRPVLLGIASSTAGHNVVAVGYDSATNTVYIHDGWDYFTHSMPWGGSYAGMTLETVSIVNLAPPVSITISGNAGLAGATLSYTDVVAKTVIADSSGNYSITVPSGWSGSIIPSHTGFTFTPGSISYTNVTASQINQNFAASWVGGVKVESNRNVVTVARPHIGAEVASYDGFSSGSLTSYVPMLFNNAYGSYNSALYVQNVAGSQANITIKYYDTDGLLKCTQTDNIAPLASKGYWIPTVACNSGSIPDGWVGGAVVTSTQSIVTVGRPHVGNEVMTYNGFTDGSLVSYIPMLFNQSYDGSYNSAFYIQNVANSQATISIKYYDNTGLLKCTKSDTINSLASKGYWVPSTTCDSGSLPVGWVGGVVVTSNQPIVGVGRPHIGTQVTTYNGFTGGSNSSYIPMLFNNTWGSYNSAFYLQNTAGAQATVTIRYYDNLGNLKCTKDDTIAPLASKGYWVPSATCDTGTLPDGWVGGVTVTSTQPVVGVGRPHIGEQVTTYNGFTAGNASSFLPMLFNNAWGAYNSAFYVQNTENSPATVTIKLYDTNGQLSCTRQDTVAALSTLGYWVPSIVCNP